MMAKEMPEFENPAKAAEWVLKEAGGDIEKIVNLSMDVLRANPAYGPQDQELDTYINTQPFEAAIKKGLEGLGHKTDFEYSQVQVNSFEYEFGSFTVSEWKGKMVEQELWQKAVATRHEAKHAFKLDPGAWGRSDADKENAHPNPDLKVQAKQAAKGATQDVLDTHPEVNAKSVNNSLLKKLAGMMPPGRKRKASSKKARYNEF